MKLSFSNLGKDQTNFIKGFAMLCLVLHNFIHLTNGIGENEMSFDSQRIYVLFDAMRHSKVMIVNGIFSYFGFYFLQLFIFISGYGLAKQYSKKPEISYAKYIFPRLIKLYSLLLFGIAVYFVLFYEMFDLRWFASFSVSSLLMYNNFSFDRIFLYVGPWWYFSLTIQLYFVFPFLYKAVSKYKEKGLFVIIGIAYILIYLLYPFLSKVNFPLFGNFLGHLPEFLLGIGLAIFPRLHLNWKVMIPTLIIFVLSNFSEYFYPFSYLSATILLLWGAHLLITYSPAWITSTFVFLGGISMFMFLINGPLRAYTLPWVGYRAPWEILVVAFIHLGIVVIVSYVMSLIYNKFIDPLITKLIRVIRN